MKMDLDLRDLNRTALERMVKALLVANDAEERNMMKQLSERARKPQKNDLADLDEEMHGKPNTPEVEDDDLPEDGEEMPAVPKKGKK